MTQMSINEQVAVWGKNVLLLLFFLKSHTATREKCYQHFIFSDSNSYLGRLKGITSVHDWIIKKGTSVKNGKYQQWCKSNLLKLT